MIKLVRGIETDGDALYPPVEFEYDGEKLSAYVKRVYCANGCEFLIRCDEDGSEITKEAAFAGICRGADVFTADFSPEPGLYYATCRIYTEDGTFYVHSTGDEQRGELRDNENICGRFQILVPGEYGSPDRLFENGNMYHIFVDRFRKSGRCERRADANYIDDWRHGIPEYTEYPGMDFPNNTFFGGDLYGIAEKLGYIKSLGCDIIYLSPVFEAFSNHKYDTGDYNVTDRCFGGEEALVGLFNKAHRLGIRVILDGVFNHTGTDSVYFNKSKKYGEGGAYNDPGSPYRDWYFFKNYPDDYECWWGIKALPKLNSENARLHEFFTGKDGIIRKYLRLGADGWRIDVADELPESLLDGIKKAALEEKPDSIIIGEVWEDASNKISYGKRRHYFSHAQLDSVMDYPLKDAVIKYVKYGDAEAFYQAFTVIKAHYPAHVRKHLMNFLGTHDTERILTVLGGTPAGGLPGSVLVTMKMDPEQYKIAKKRFFTAFSLLCFCPGIVSVYYGDEVGMQGYRDPFNRMPYPWGHGDTGMRKEISALLNFRKTLTGDADIVYAKDGVIIMARGDYILISNASGKPVTVAVDGVYTDIKENVYERTINVPDLNCIILHK